MSYEPLTQVAVERQIFQITQQMDEGVVELADAVRNAAVADVAFKVKFAQETLKAAGAAGGRITVDDKKAQATIECEPELRRQLITESYAEVAREKMRTLRARLDGLRTVSSNIRSQT